MLITRFTGLAPWEATYGYSRVVVAGNWAITAGTTATGPDGVLHPGDPYRQTLAAFTIALEALKAAGAAPEQVVRTRMYVEVARLADPVHLVEVEVEAYLRS